MRRYTAARRADVLSRTMVIDLANRSLLSELLPMQSLRAAGLHLIGAIGPLRRLAMREGLAPSWRHWRRTGYLGALALIGIRRTAAGARLFFWS